MKKLSTMSLIHLGVYALCIILLFTPFVTASAMGISISISAIQFIFGGSIAGMSFPGTPLMAVLLIVPIVGILLVLFSKNKVLNIVLAIVLSVIGFIFLGIISWASAGYGMGITTLGFGWTLTAILYVVGIVLFFVNKPKAE